ncbi:alpha/beta-hydrolase [Serendipita vermifera]|nr:alpha/beta-hydrolase [Serendipita vermifera]
MLSNIINTLVWGLALTSTLTYASPAPEPAPVELEERALQTLSSAERNALKTYTLFSAAVWCSPLLTRTWTCGSKCLQLPGFKVVDSGGDGAIVQYWFVGYHPPLNSIIVAYQGTDVTKIIPSYVDANVVLTSPSQTLFPGLPRTALLHAGFLGAYTVSQASVLAAIQRASTTYGTKNVTYVGHSLGAAIAAISAASMKLRLGSGWNHKVVVYGQPRVGNQAWVTWLDSNVPDLTRINNKNDIVPTVPTRAMGYVGSDGEVHIRLDGSWAVCPGNDNMEIGCTARDVVLGNIIDHLGPYDGVWIGCA